MSEKELRRGSVTKQAIVSAFMETRRQLETQTKDHDPCDSSLLEDILSRKLDPICDSVADLNAQLKELSSSLVALNKKYSDLQCEFRDKEEELYNEIQERHRRRKCIVISGLPEPVAGSPDERKAEDKDAILRVAQSCGADLSNMKELSRIGKINGSRPRLLLVKCKDTRQKFDVLRLSKNLRKNSNFRNVYINPDLTVTERNRDRQLREELRQRRSKGEDVFIKHGKIVKREDQNFQ